MTRSEYQELVEFLGPRFDRIDHRFEAIDRRFDAMDQRFDAMDQRFEGIEERLTRVEVSLEENRHQTQVLAEGITAVDQRLRRGFEAQGKLIRGIGVRVDQLEIRLA